MFLNKIKNIFCFPDTKFVSATNVARAGKRGNNRSFSLSRNKKNKLKAIQWKKLRNWDVIEDKKIRHFSKF